MRTILLAAIAMASCSHEAIAPPPAQLPPPPPPPDRCAPGEWCWVRGLPRALGKDREVAYVVGGPGQLHLWQDNQFRAHPLPTSASVLSAWIGGDANVWASDNQGGLWHFEGTRWTEESDGRLFTRLQGTVDGSLFAITAEATGDPVTGLPRRHLLRREGAHWVEPALIPTYCVGGAIMALTANDLYAAGVYCDPIKMNVAGAEVVHWDGAGWALLGKRFAGDYYHADLSVVAGRLRVSIGGAYDWDGASWQPAEITDFPNPPPDLTTLYDGVDLIRLPIALGCEVALRTDAAHRFCYGHGRVYQYDGKQWTLAVPDPFDNTQSPDRWGQMPASLWAGSDSRLAWGTGPTNVYRVRPSNGDRLEHFDGVAWRVILDAPVHDLDGGAGPDLWLVTKDGVLRARGETVTAISNPPTARLTAHVRVLGDGRVVASDHRALFVLDGDWSLLQELPANRGIADIAGSGVNDLWLAAGHQDRSNEINLMHYDGRAWSELPVEGLTYTAHLDTFGAETWLASERFIINLRTSERILYDYFSQSAAHFEVDGGGLWLTSPSQSQWHSR